MVLTPRGQRRIDSLRPGSLVLSLDVNGNVVSARVTRTVIHKRPHPILHVVSSNSELSFFATKRHPVQTHRGWVRIKDLRPGDVLSSVSEDGSVFEHEVLRIDRSDRFEAVYNLVVDGDHTFIVHGCVAHSFVYLRRLRTLLCKIGRLVGRRSLDSEGKPRSTYENGSCQPQLL